MKKIAATTAMMRIVLRCRTLRVAETRSSSIETRSTSGTVGFWFELLISIQPLCRLACLPHARAFTRNLVLRVQFHAKAQSEASDAKLKPKLGHPSIARWL